VLVLLMEEETNDNQPSPLYTLPPLWSKDLSKLILKVTILSCANLRAVDKGGTSDPYVKVRPKDGAVKWLKTPTIKKTLDPVWNNAILDFDGVSMKDGFEIEVWDHNAIQKDKLLGSAQFTVDDPELTEQAFPEYEEAVRITKSLGDGNGTVCLQICPHFGSKLKYHRREAEHWPAHSYPLSTGETVTFRLPSTMKELPGSDQSYATFMIPVTSASDRYRCLMFLGSAGTVEISDKEDLEKVIENVITEIPIATKNSVKHLGDRGQIKIGGKDAVWATFYVDWTEKDRTYPYSSALTQIVYGIGSTAKHFHLYSFASNYPSHDVPSEKDTLLMHQKRFDETWSHVLEGITFS